MLGIPGEHVAMQMYVEEIVVSGKFSSYHQASASHTQLFSFEAQELIWQNIRGSWDHVPDHPCLQHGLLVLEQ